MILAFRRFRGGVHPPEHKEATSGSPIRRAPVPARLVVPMSQHLGAPCQPVVQKGDRVRRGQVIGDVEAMVSAPVHSPVDGEVLGIVDTLLPAGNRSKAVEIRPDEQQDFNSFVEVDRTGDVKSIVRAAGIVGLGGAAFPSSVKLQPPKDMPVTTVILNGCECEPFLTADHRMMLESADRVVAGARIIADAVGAARVVIGVEDNKPDAIEALRAAAGEDIEVLALPTAYPQGAEKQLIWAVLGKEVPKGKLPAATGALVHNVGTAAAIADAVELGKPLMERVVTVTGAVGQPANYLTLLGTPIETLIEAAGGLAGEVGRVVSGGPMTGFALGRLDVPVTKGTSGVTVLTPEQTPRDVNGDQPCIRCGRCVEACPMFLQPYAIGIFADRRDWDRAEAAHVLDCVECGSCAFACPTGRPLVQLIRRAKSTVMIKGAKQ